MLMGSAAMLTLVTLLGLVSGLAREWLLVASWGAGARADGFLVASFLSEAVRTMLAGGLLSSAAMALWQGQDQAQRVQWLGRTTFGFMMLGGVLALGVTLGADEFARLIGPGLDQRHLPRVSQTLSIMVWAIPFMLLQALWAVPMQASGRFLLPGLASLIYNLPGVVYLAWQREQASEYLLAWTFVFGGAATALLLMPATRAHGLHGSSLRWHGETMRELGARVGHIFGSAVSGQALQLFERMVASYLGEGVVTVLNLARKLANLPLVALMSVNQVLLGMMSKAGIGDTLVLLRQGLALNTLITTPAAVGMLLSAQALVQLLFPRVQGAQLLGPLLGWYAAALVVAGWNALLARYHHAQGETRLPFFCEVSGNLLQALALPLLAWLWGVQGIAAALLLGVLVSGVLLLHTSKLWGRVGLPGLLVAASVPLMISAYWLLPVWPVDPWWRLLVSTGVASGCMVALAACFKPWRAATA